MSRTRILALVLALVAGPSPRAFAEVLAADEVSAKRSFGEGEKAYKKGDFLVAAAAFDEANRLAPHPAALWNAARAWHRGGEHPRAANLYRRYLRVSPGDAADRGGATAALAELMQKLGRVDVVAPDGATVRIDKTPLEGAGLAVNPGSHVLEAELGDRRERRVVEVLAGAVVSVTVLEPGPPAPSAKEPGPQPSTPAPLLPPPLPSTPPAASVSPPARAERPLPAWSLAVGGGLTAVLTSLTIGFGLDVLSKRDAYDAAPSQALFDSGQSAQLATNALLGVTLGVGAVTLALAVFATEWSPPPPPGPRRVKSPGACYACR